MLKAVKILLVVSMLFPLAACWTAAGAAGGYIYSEQSDKKDGDLD